MKVFRALLLPLIVSTVVTCKPYLPRIFSLTDTPIASEEIVPLIGHFGLENDLNALRGIATTTTDVSLSYGVGFDGTGTAIDVDREQVYADLGPQVYSRVLTVTIPSRGGTQRKGMTISLWSNLLFVLVELRSDQTDDWRARMFELNFSQQYDTLAGEYQFRGQTGRTSRKRVDFIPTVIEWRHLTIVIDQLQTVWLYVDGRIVGSMSAINFFPIQDELYLFIGLNSWGPDEAESRFLLDELIIIDGALDEEAVRSLYDGTYQLDALPDAVPE